jgi:hypothetical protein
MQLLRLELPVWVVHLFFVELRFFQLHQLLPLQWVPLQQLRLVHQRRLHILPQHILPELRPVPFEEGCRRHLLRCRRVHVRYLHGRRVLRLHHLRHVRRRQLHRVCCYSLPQLRPMPFEESERGDVRCRRRVHVRHLLCRSLLQVHQLRQLHHRRLHCVPRYVVAPPARGDVQHADALAHAVPVRHRHRCQHCHRL